MKAKEIQFQKGITPTVISFDTEKQDFIIGEEAKAGGIKGRTNAFNFKRYIGEPDSIYKKNSTLWVAPDGSKNTSTIQSFSYEKATRIFLEKLLEQHEIPKQLYIGIPSIPEENWLTNYKTHIRQAFNSLGFPEPKFVWEPFAVFQTFKKSQAHLDFKSKSIMIIDIGGSTFNSCIVRSTSEGKFSTSSASGRPLGVKSSFTGGVHIDKEVLLSWLEATKAIVKEDPKNIIKDKSLDSYLYSIEKAKIVLSKKYRSRSIKEEERKKLFEEIDKDSPLRKTYPESCPRIEIAFLLSAIRKTVTESWIPQLQETIETAKDHLAKSNMGLEKIDYIVLAGGSAQLPLLVDEMIQALSYRLPSKKFIFNLEENGYSVAKGLAITAEEDSTSNPELVSNASARCLAGDLYLGVKSYREDDYQFPEIVSTSNVERGAILHGVVELNEEDDVLVDIELPFVPKDHIHLCFFHSKEDAENNICLNTGKHIHHLGHDSRLTKRAVVKVKIKNNNYIEASIEVEGKKPSDTISLGLGAFDLENISIARGKKLIGIDFGNSNSYVVEYIAESNETLGFEYPNFEIKSSAKTKLVEFNRLIVLVREKGFLERTRIVDFSKRQLTSAVYHSNKIENDKVSFGDTKRIIEIGDEAPKNVDELEVRNLANSYRWVLDNYDQFFDSPLMFIREINKMILKDISSDGGRYRDVRVELSGSSFLPPLPYEIPSLMEKLELELKGSFSDRSFLEIACTFHTKFVHIHPFVDGNGRTARLILDTILLSFNFPAVIVKVDEKVRYISCLQDSNSGDLSSFIQLYVDTALQTLAAFEKDISEKSFELFVDKNKSVYEDLDSQEDPLHYVIESYSKNIVERRLEYFDIFKAECKALRLQFHKLSSELAINKIAASSGMEIKVKDYDVLTEHSCREILLSRDEKFYWFFSFTAVCKSVEVGEYCFAFKLDDRSDCGIAIYLGKVIGEFNVLTTDPLRLRVLVFNGEKSTLDAINAEGVITNKPYSDVTKMLIAEVFKFYGL